MMIYPEVFKNGPGFYLLAVMPEGKLYTPCKDSDLFLIIFNQLYFGEHVFHT